ncbi:MAG: hypothetical protein GQ532_18485 [Methylomarinum sp.]|nr:hypothetical protein [Methylomarinum sp.]
MEKVPQQIPTYAPMYQQEDEIDLFELWGILWQQKVLIIVVTFITVMMAVAYLMITQPVYKAETFFLPPLQQDVQSLNLQGVKKNTVASVYEQFLNNVQSRQLRQQFYDKHNLLAWYSKDREIEEIKQATVFEKEFYDKLKIKLPKKGDKTFVSFSFELNDPAKAAEWLNKYVDLVIFKTKQQLVQGLYAELKIKKINISDKIASMRKVAENRRLDRVVQLQESLEIAKAAGVHDSQINQAANELNMEYMRGTKVLEREIQLLNSRKLDDPFILGINDLKQEYAYLESAKVNIETIYPVRIDQVAVEPEKPIKPKKILVIAIAIVLGGMIGIFSAFIRHAIKKRRKEIDAV